MSVTTTPADARQHIDAFAAESAKSIDSMFGEGVAKAHPDLVLMHVRLTIMLIGYPKDYLLGGPSRKGVAHGRHVWGPCLIDGVVDPTQDMCSVCEAVRPHEDEAI